MSIRILARLQVKTISDRRILGAKIHYNLRVVETLVGARVLALRLGQQLGPSDRPRLREVFSRWLGSPELESSPEKVKAELLRFLPEIEKLRPSLGERVVISVTSR